MDVDLIKFLSDTLGKYSDIPMDQIELLAGKLKYKKIKKNEYFIQQGDAISSFALIYSGIFRIFCNDILGNEKSLSFRRTGDFLAGYTPFIEKKRIWYSIQALEDSEILYADFKFYEELEKAHPCWNDLIKKYIIRLFIEKENREYSLLLEDATTRYLNFRNSFPYYESKISQYHIASYLGITPVSLSRIRSQLKNSTS